MKKLFVILFAVVMSVMMVVPAFAFDYGVIDVPQVESINPSDLVDYPYWFITGDNKLFLTDVPCYSDFNGMYGSSAMNYKIYYLDANNETWEKPYAGQISNSAKVNTFLALVSNYDIYDSNGNLFLKKWSPPPKPLAETILDLTGDTIKNDTVPSVTSTMTILCVNGVALLAMLVLFRLFGKPSLFKR